MSGTTTNALCECGHEESIHTRDHGAEWEQKYGGPDLCYGNGDGGCPGPDCGRPPCPCRRYVAAALSPA